MKKLFILFLWITHTGLAQDLVLATIDDSPISAGEVLYAFQKNRPDSLGIELDSLDEYLDRYINFKLKVLEARNQGMDTTKVFRNELNNYLSALKKPYAEGTDLTDQLVKEAYERMQFNFKASHILLKISPNAGKEDTLVSYTFLDSLRSTVTNERQFAELAKTYSEDGSAQNGGDLGWFNVFMMVYPFETAAYQTPIGEVSQIVRTEFGYHLIFVQDRIKNPGRLRTSHIFFSKQLHSANEAERLADQVYDSLQLGADWGKMVRKYSEDSQTKMKGGGLPFAGLKQLPDEYMEQAFGLKINEIAPPVETSFGYHIIRLDAVKKIPELDQVQQEIEEQIIRSGRNELSNQALLEKLKKEYGFRKNEKTYTALQMSEGLEAHNLNKEILFSIKDRDYRVDEWHSFTSPKKGMPPQLEAFEKEMLLSYADSVAPIQYPEYRYLRQEYEEGLLLFEVMQKVVWNKAIEDSLGQRNYYEAHRTIYLAPATLAVYEIESSTLSERKLLQDELKKIDRETLLAQFEKREGVTEELKLVKREAPVSEFASFEGFKKDRGTIFARENTLIVVIKETKNRYLPLEEVRGLVIADYQEELDNLFIQQLRSQHEIEKYQNALLKLINEQQ